MNFVRCMPTIAHTLKPSLLRRVALSRSTQRLTRGTRPRDCGSKILQINLSIYLDISLSLAYIRIHENANHSDHRRTSQGIQAEMRIRRSRYGCRREQAD